MRAIDVIMYCMYCMYCMSCSLCTVLLITYLHTYWTCTYVSRVVYVVRLHCDLHSLLCRGLNLLSE